MILPRENDEYTQRVLKVSNWTLSNFVLELIWYFSDAFRVLTIFTRLKSLQLNNTILKRTIHVLFLDRIVCEICVHSRIEYEYKFLIELRKKLFANAEGQTIPYEYKRL